MGLCNSVQSAPKMADLTDVQKQQHKDIEKNMKQFKKTDLELRRLLLLGAGSSGKSTLFRQLKCVYKAGFGDNEYEETIPIIRRNCVAGILVLLKKSEAIYECDKKENYDCFIDLENDDNNNNINAEAILNSIKNIVLYAKDTFDGYENDVKFQEYRCKNDNDDTIDDYLETRIQATKDKLYELGEDIKYIWLLPQIQSTFKKRQIYQYSFPDNLEHFFNKLSDIFGWGFQPNDEDILKCRIRTTGIVHDNYDITNDNGDIHSFTITDVGGQRNERRKWIHSFEGVTAVIFVAALNHYSAVLFEDESKNAMIESIELFYEICNSKWFKKTEIILFLNKDDLFRELILNDICLGACFNEKNQCIWKKEYVDERNYYPTKKEDKIKMYGNTRNGSGRNKAPQPPTSNNDYSQNSLERVHNESESLSFSQESLINLSEEEYRKRAAIYPKKDLKYSLKDTYDNNKWKMKTNDEWFEYIYMDYLNFITEMYNCMNLQRATKRIFIHVTTATDADNVQKVFWDVQNIVIRSNLSRGGLM